MTLSQPWRMAVPTAVVAGVAAADDQHALARGGNRLAVRKVGIQQTAGHAGQVIHRKEDALRVAAGAWMSRACFAPQHSTTAS